MDEERKEAFRKWVHEVLNPTRKDKPLSEEEIEKCIEILEEFDKKWSNK